MSTIIIPNPDTPFFQADNTASDDGGQIISADFTGPDTDDGYLGSDGSDLIFTFGGDDAVLAGTGNDEVTAGAGNDSVGGGVGNDSIALGEGDDLGVGGIGDDTIDAGVGNDLVLGGDGSDSITGGEGNDTLGGGGGFPPQPLVPKKGDKGFGIAINLDCVGRFFGNLGRGVAGIFRGGRGRRNSILSLAETESVISSENIVEDEVSLTITELEEEINNIIEVAENLSEENIAEEEQVEILTELFNNFEASVENLIQVLASNGEEGLKTEFVNYYTEFIDNFDSDNLFGGLGNDFLIGGSGADNFQFDNIIPGEMDTIADFAPGVDKIQFISSDFLSEEGEFNYNSETGIISYNPDGIADNGDEINFLQLQGDLELNIDEDFEFL